MKNRINHLKKFSLATASVLTASSAWGQAPKQPNIIMFIVDDMGWQDTSEPFWSQVTSWNQRYQTPNMQRLAAHGMKFTQAYSCAISSPSRCSLITGMNAARHRVTNWTLHNGTSTDGSDNTLSFPAWNVNGVQPVNSVNRATYATTLPQILKDNGYYTIHCGKSHIGSAGTPGANPLTLGYDFNIAGSEIGGPGSYLGTNNYSAVWRGGGTAFDVPGLSKYHGTDTFLSEALTLEALKQLDTAQVKGKPFYLYMAHYAVHIPIERDNRFYQKYASKGIDEQEAEYAAIVEGMDKSLGDLMNYLDAHNLTDNTIILFMSDNGGYSATTGSLQRGGTAHYHNIPLRAGKGSIYEGGIREPMIVKWPGVTKDSTVCNDYLQIEDFFPSILEMAGVQNYSTVQTVDGKSFVPLLKQEPNPNPDRCLYWHFPNKWGEYEYGSECYSAIRSGDYKLIYRWATGGFEMYNIRQDIGETKNIVWDNLALGKSLVTKLSNYLRSVNAQRPSFKTSGALAPWPDEVDMSPRAKMPQISDGTNTYWYYLKNHGDNNRYLNALAYVSAGKFAGADAWRGTHAKFKVVQGDSVNTYGIVDESGLYLQPNGDATFASTVFKNWHIALETTGSITAYRIYTTPTVLFHMRVGTATPPYWVRTYNVKEVANLWSFIPEKPETEYKLSDATNQHWYGIRNLAADGRKGLYITATADGATMAGAFVAQPWKVMASPTTGKYYIVNKDGLYLTRTLSGSNFISKSAPDSTAEWQINMAMSDFERGYILTNKFKQTGEQVLNQAVSPYNYKSYTTYDNASVWEFVPEATSTALNDTHYFNIRLINGYITIEGVTNFNVYAANGLKVNTHQPLRSGVYIVEANGAKQKLYIE